MVSNCWRSREVVGSDAECVPVEQSDDDDDDVDVDVDVDDAACWWE